MERVYIPKGPPSPNYYGSRSTATYLSNSAGSLGDGAWGVGRRAVRLPGDPKTYGFRGYTLKLRGHNILFCRVWGVRVRVRVCWYRTTEKASRLQGRRVQGSGSTMRASECMSLPWGRDTAYCSVLRQFCGSEQIGPCLSLFT